MCFCASLRQARLGFVGAVAAAAPLLEILCRCAFLPGAAPSVQPWSRSRGGVDGFLVGPVNGQLWDELDEKNVFHHAVGVTPLLSKLPVQSKLVVEMAVLPIQNFLY